MEGFSKDLKELMQFPKEGIFSTVLTKTESQNTTLMCLSKGTNIDTHTSTKEGIVYVIKGKGKFKLEENDIDMIEGKLIFMPKDAPHSLKAEEDTAILLQLTN